VGGGWRWSSEGEECGEEEARRWGELVGVEAAMVIVKGWVGGDLEGQKIKRDIKSSKILKLVWISQRR
jgi:hypothetical protein